MVNIVFGSHNTEEMDNPTQSPQLPENGDAIRDKEEASSVTSSTKGEEGGGGEPCPTCGQTFAKRGDLTKHRKMKGHAVFPCPDRAGCRRMFFSEAALRDHLRMTAHEAAEDGAGHLPADLLEEQQEQEEAFAAATGAAAAAARAAARERAQAARGGGGDKRRASTGAHAAGGRRSSAAPQPSPPHRKPTADEDDNWRGGGGGGAPRFCLLPARTPAPAHHHHGGGGGRARSQTVGHVGGGGGGGRARSSTLGQLGPAPPPPPPQQQRRQRRDSNAQQARGGGGGGGRQRSATEWKGGGGLAAAAAGATPPRREPRHQRESFTLDEAGGWASSPPPPPGAAPPPPPPGRGGGGGGPTGRLRAGTAGDVELAQSLLPGGRTPQRGAKHGRMMGKLGAIAEDALGGGGGPATCPNCHKTYLTENALMGHTGGAAPGTLFPCAEPGCGQRCCSRYELSAHKWDAKHGFPEPVSCPTPGCGALFASAERLRAHWDGEEHAPPYRGVRCPHCPMAFCSLAALHQHAKLWGHFPSDHVFVDRPNPFAAPPPPPGQPPRPPLEARHEFENPFFASEDVFESCRSPHETIEVEVTGDPGRVRAWLLEHVLYQQGARRAVGLDVEWKPCPTAAGAGAGGHGHGAAAAAAPAGGTPAGPDPNRVALIQICREGRCLVIRMGALPTLPGELLFLLASPEFVKAGIGIKADLERLERYYGIFCHGFFDVGIMSSMIFPDVKSGSLMSLRNVARKLCGVHLEKLKTATRSNWELTPLTEAQVQSAAAEAAAGWETHRVLTQNLQYDEAEHCYELELKVRAHLEGLCAARKPLKDLLSALHNFCGTEAALQLCYRALYSYEGFRDASCLRTRLAVECVKRGFPLPHYEAYGLPDQEYLHSNVRLRGQVIGASYSVDKSDALETASEFALNHLMTALP